MSEVLNLTILEEADDATSRAVIYVNGELYETANHVTDAGFVWELLTDFTGRIIGTLDLDQRLKADWFAPRYRSGEFPQQLADIPEDAYEDEDA